jgi:hypothetical protein
MTARHFQAVADNLGRLPVTRARHAAMACTGHMITIIKEVPYG